MDDLRDQLGRLRLRAQADVHRLWELLMGPLGFAYTAVWVCFLDGRGALTAPVMKVGDEGDCRVPTSSQVGALVDHLSHLVGGEGGIDSVAVLLSHPGRAGLTASDRRFATDLLAACRAAGVTCHPVHVADDLAIVAVSPDDLVR